MTTAKEMTFSQAAVETQKVDEVELLVREHARFVYRVAYSVLRNGHDAEDAVQETFLRVVRHAAELPAVREQRAWLARIAYRIAIDRRRHQAARPQAADDEQAVARLRDAAPGAEQQLIDAEMLSLLERVVSSLPADQRDVVTLSTVEEMSGREIAEILGISEAGVRGKLFRARQALRERLQGLLGN
jgi:RNA polymerase sigma-70 factor (ECF subfamily)